MKMSQNGAWHRPAIVSRVVRSSESGALPRPHCSLSMLNSRLHHPQSTSLPRLRAGAIDALAGSFPDDFFKGCQANRRGGAMAVRLRAGRERNRDMQRYDVEGVVSGDCLRERGHGT